MEKNVNYLVGLLAFLDVLPSDFYSIGITNDKITLQGKYKGDFAKKFIGWTVDGINGYLNKDGEWATSPQEADSITIAYKITLTD